jgi:hypothetical protein
MARPEFPEVHMLAVRRLSALTVLALVALTSSLAYATVVVPLTLADQVQRADLVVRARVGSVRSAYVAERGTILSWTELEVMESLKGQAPVTLTLRQMGGTAEGQTMLVPGDAHLAPGQEVILFLRRDRNGTNDVFLLALAQSAYVVRGQQASRDLSQLTFAVLGDGTQLSEPGHEASVGVDTLVSQIRSLAGGGQ